MEKCDVCGSHSMTSRKGDYELEYRDQSGQIRPLLVKSIEWSQCEDCGEALFGPAAMDAIEDARRAALGLLSKDDFIGLRKRLGLSQSAIAELIGCGEKTYCRWESGSYLHSEATDRYVRLLIEDANNIELLKDICVTKAAGTPEQQILQLSQMFTSLDLADPTIVERESRFTNDLVEGKLQTAATP